jgi:hypothetical protein
MLGISVAKLDFELHSSDPYATTQAPANVTNCRALRCCYYYFQTTMTVVREEAFLVVAQRTIAPWI